MNLICAIDSKYGIGIDNNLPWKLKSDMEYFKKITCSCLDKNKKNAVIMGRKTWESIPIKYRPLKDRINLVISRLNPECTGADLVTNNIDLAINYLNELNNVENIFVIGGSQIYDIFMKNKEKYKLNKLYITHIHKNLKCNRFLPEIGPQYKLDIISELKKENNLSFRFAEFKPIINELLYFI